MPVETAADRAALFDADEFGTAATYTPACGDSIACTVVFDHDRAEPFELGPDRRSPIRGVLARQRALVRKDEVPAPAQGGTLTIGGTIHKIVTRPQLDATGEIWEVDLER